MSRCQECDIDIPIVRARDRRKKYCTRQCWLKVMHRTGQVPYGKNAVGAIVHGHCKAVTGTISWEYRAWKSMRGRCRNHPYYVNHGISVYDGWSKFTGFLDYVVNTLGPHPGKGWSLDRIDSGGHYEPGNVRWATVIQQRHNQRRWIERHHSSE